MKNRMKVQLGAYVLMAVMVFSGLATGVSGNERVNIKENAVAFNIVSAGYLFLPPNNGQWCTVSTDGGRLNVRNSNGTIVTKLANGTEVWVTEFETTDIEWAKVHIERRGKLVYLGWAAAEYIYCGE